MSNPMVAIYVSLIRKKLKTIDQVPEIIREEVRKIIESDME